MSRIGIKDCKIYDKMVTSRLLIGKGGGGIWQLDDMEFDVSFSFLKFVHITEVLPWSDGIVWEPICRRSLRAL